LIGALRHQTTLSRQIHQILAFGMEDGGVAALDVEARRLYWFGQRMGAPISAPFFLVGLDLATGAVMTEAQLCTDIAMCPTSLEWAPDQHAK
jgi:hypothetical protein